MLWRVPFTVVGKSEIVVEAKDRVDAGSVAEMVLAAARPGRLEIHSNEIEVDLEDVRLPDGPDPQARCSTYICTFCGAQRLKADWGPGRVTCPACHRVAPSAVEFHELQMRDADGLTDEQCDAMAAAPWSGSSGESDPITQARRAAMRRAWAARPRVNGEESK